MMMAVACTAGTVLTTQAADVYHWSAAKKDTGIWSGKFWLLNGKGKATAWEDGADALLTSGSANKNITLNSAVTANSVAVQGDYALTLDLKKTQAVSFGTVDIATGCTLSVSSDTAKGTFTVGGGTLADQAKLQFSGGAAYTLTGAYAVTTAATEGGATAPAATNGFATADFSATVVETSGGAALDTTGATWTLNGLSASYADGIVSAKGTIYDTYYINQGAVSVSGIFTEAGEHSGEVKSAELNAGTLNLNADIENVNANGGSITMNGGSNTNGTANLAEGVVLSVAGDTGNLTFTGGTLGEGAKFSFSGAATYTLQGQYDVQGGTIGGGSTPAKNGFASGTFSADVVEGDVNTANATWTLNGLSATYNSGTISAEGTDYSTYYVVESGSTIDPASVISKAGDKLKKIAVATTGDSIDGGSSQATYALPEIDLQAGSDATLLGGGEGGNGADVTYRVDTLSTRTGNARLTVGTWTDSPPAGVDKDGYWHTALQVGNTVVGDNAQLTVDGISGVEQNTLGRITLGTGATLALAGHRYSNKEHRFNMAVNGGTMGDGSVILLSKHDPALSGGEEIATYADYTLAGEFSVTTSHTGEIKLPTGNGFATADVSAVVLRNETDSEQVLLDTQAATWRLNGSEAQYSYKNNIGTISATTTVFETWYQKHDAVSVSHILETAGEGAPLVKTVELTGGSLTVDDDISTVNAKGGSIGFGAKGTVGAINVIEDTTVSGDTNPAAKAYNISAQKKVTFENNLDMNGLSVTGDDKTKVSIQNTSDATVRYSLQQEAALLSACTVKLTSAAKDNTSVGNRVAAGAVENESAFDLDLLNGVDGLQHVTATNGNILFHNMGTNIVSLTDMTVGEGGMVGLYQGADASNPIAVTINQALNAGGSTVQADLALAAGSSLNLGGKALTMGADSSFNVGGIVDLDDATLALIQGLQVGESQLLVGFAGEADTDIVDGAWARAYFNLDSITDSDFKMSVEGSSISIEKVSNVPEPATGTLSLLALAALAARRRRK